MTSIEPTDIATVPESLMLIAFNAVVRSGKAGIFFNGAESADRHIVEEAFWADYEGNTSLGGITLIRLWQLVDVLQARRMQTLALDRGFRFIESAFIAASQLRLNLDWGFMPQRLYWAVEAIDRNRIAETPAPARIAQQEFPDFPVAA